MDYSTIGWLSATIVLSAGYAYLAKRYVLTTDWSLRALYFSTAVLTFIALFFSYTKVLASHSMSVAFALSKIGSVVLMAIVGATLFYEAITHKQIVGMLLAMAAGWLLV